FNFLQFFVFCHGLLQLAQLLVSSYLKSSISTIEKRYGLSSQTSGLLASFNEVGNTILIVFVSFFGSRVHRPRFIGGGALIASIAGFLMALPHLVTGHYEYDRSFTNVPQNQSDPKNGMENERQTVLAIMFIGQLLLGIGGVPIQPFGISYIDDYASERNSPLYIGILFSITVLGPALAFMLGSVMLRFYVDIDKFKKAAPLKSATIVWIVCTTCKTVHGLKQLLQLVRANKHGRSWHVLDRSRKSLGFGVLLRTAAFG
ncbi:SO2B1 protein, partial [Polypterus senegalus]